MKKLYILGLMGLSVIANAQKPNLTKSAAVRIGEVANDSRQRDYEIPSPVRINNNKSIGNGYNKYATWTTVGQTQFDRQTNSSVYRRIKAFPSGEISVVWTASPDGPTNNFLGRGSGYNHFNGTTWGPVTSQRVESQRTGYPNLDFDGTTEVIVSHKVDTSGQSGGLAYNTNGSVGGTTWNTNIVLTPEPTKPSVLWPRTAVANGYMHIVANYTSSAPGQPDSVIKSGVVRPTVYSRYKISNNTWEVENITLPGYDSTRYHDGNADGYSIDAKDSIVVVLIGDVFTDVTMWKSTDNGNSWTKTIIDSFPVPAYNDDVIIDDTVQSTDGSMNVILDNQGQAHCFWGLAGMQNTTIGDGRFTLWTFNGIAYWTEAMPDSIRVVAAGFDENGDGTYTRGSMSDASRYGFAGMATMPYAAIDASGKIFLVYSALTDNDLTTQGDAYRDVYVVSSQDNGTTWGIRQNLTATMGPLVEQMFASTSLLNDTLHITFMVSNIPGFYSSTDNSGKTGTFDIVYYQVPVSNILGGNAGMDESNSILTVGTNYPNPFRNSTVIPVNLTQKADVKVSIVNILGEEVFSKTYNNTTTGLNNIEINGNFKAGFYFYNIEAAGTKVSGKMLAE